MRGVFLLVLLTGLAQAQIQPEAARLFHVAAREALQRLERVDLDVDLESSSPMAGGPRILTKHVSISVRKPDNVRVSVQMKDGTDVFLLSGGAAWIYDSYHNEYGTRPAVIRPDIFLSAVPDMEMLPADHAVESAEITGEERLRIGATDFVCTVIKVVSHVNSTNDRIEILSVDKTTGVPLKRVTRYTNPRSGTSTVTVTRLLTGDAVGPVSFETSPPTSYKEEDEVFHRLFLAFPTNGPEFSFSSSGAPAITLASLSGAPAIVNFGAPGCAPCEQDRATFEAAARSLTATWGRAVRVLVGNPADMPPVESPYYTTVYATPEQFDRMGIQVLPSTMVTTPRGTIYRIEQGHIGDERMLRMVELGKEQRPLAADAGYFMAGEVGVVAPVLSFRTPVTMTSEARALNISGRVQLAILANSDGTVRHASVIHSLNPLLDALAVDAVQKWIFKPGTCDGKPVSVMFPMQIEFKSDP